MAKILFISDNLLNESLGIMSLSSCIKALGHLVDLTLLADHQDMDSLLAYIRCSGVDIIGFSVMTPQVTVFRPLTSLIKEKTGLPVIWGGAHCTYMAEQVTSYPGIDYICVGEGEEPLMELMARLNSGESCLDITGLWARDSGGEWHRNAVGNLQPLDQYPPPDRELYYDKYPLLAGFGVKRFMTQRGCPYKCSYCFEPSMADMYDGKGVLVRRRSIDHVIAEIRKVVARYPTRQVHFTDDTFNLNKRWVLEFCERYKVEIGLPFSCSISVQIVDEQLVAAMKAAGCRGVIFGLETGVEKTRREVLNKPISNATYVETCRLLRKHGIHYITTIMFALPNETLEHAIESIRFNRILRPLGTKAHILKIYKGTKLAEHAMDRNLSKAEGEFTFKSLDVDSSHMHQENLLWAGYLLVKIPGLIYVARPLLTSWWSKYLRPLILFQNLQDLIFLNISPIQAFTFFWKSRKSFMLGIGGRQNDTYLQDE